MVEKIWSNENIDMRTDTNKKDVKSTGITIQSGRNGSQMGTELWEHCSGGANLEPISLCSLYSI